MKHQILAAYIEENRGLKPSFDCDMLKKSPIRPNGSQRQQKNIGEWRATKWAEKTRHEPLATHCFLFSFAKA